MVLFVSVCVHNISMLSYLLTVGWSLTVSCYNDASGATPARRWTWHNACLLFPAGTALTAVAPGNVDIEDNCKQTS